MFCLGNYLNLLVGWTDGIVARWTPIYRLPNILTDGAEDVCWPTGVDLNGLTGAHSVTLPLVRHLSAG